MKVLAITNLFPNSREPGRGIFNKQQFIELAKLCELKVVAPLPFTFGVKRIYHDVPLKEVIHGIEVHHPRYLVTPKVGRRFYGWWFYRGIKKTVNEILKDFNCTVILATWAYPDSYGVSILAREIGKPLVIRVHGSDINVFTKSISRRKRIQKAFARSNKIIAVSQGLKKIITQMGNATEKIALIPNGVDKGLFRPLDTSECRRKLNLPFDKKHVLFIGNLVDIKGIEYLIKAFEKLSPEVVLHILGEGELKNKLILLSKEFKVSDRVYFHGRVAHHDIPIWMNAADVFCLPSLNEGCPNVLVESTACGLPFVASNVGGIPDAAEVSPSSMLVEPKNPAQIAQALQTMLQKMDRQVDTNAAMSWQENAAKVYGVLKQAAFLGDEE